MYKMIGGDGREYGPVSLEELEAWIREGRVLSDTWIFSDREEIWKKAAGWPELREMLSQVAPSTDPEAPIVGFVPASRLPRLAAYLIDIFLISFVGTNIWVLLHGASSTPSAPPPDLATLEELLQYMSQHLSQNIPEILFVQCIRIAYDVLCHKHWGATLGKFMVGIRLLSIDGQPLSYGRLLLRFFARFLSEFPLYIGYFPILFRRDHRGLHDLLSLTQVVKNQAWVQQPRPGY